MKKSLLTVLLLLATTLTYAADMTGKYTLRYSILGDSYSTYEGYLTPDTNLIWYYRPDKDRKSVV